MSTQPPRRRLPSLDELRALRDRLPPIPEPRQLSAEELEELRARLNRGEDPRDANEHTAYYQLGVIRYEHHVDDLRARVSDEALDTPPEATTRSYAEGILDALAWARGEQEQGPATGRTETDPSPGTGALAGEGAAASQMLRGHRAMRPGVSTSYLSGAEATLLWLVCTGPNPWT